MSQYLKNYAITYMLLGSLVDSNVKEINHDLHQHSYIHHFEM